MELDHTCVVIEAQKALFNIFFTFDFEDMNDSDTFNLSIESTDQPQRDRNYSRALAQDCLINLEKMLDSDVSWPCRIVFLWSREWHLKGWIDRI